MQIQNQPQYNKNICNPSFKSYYQPVTEVLGRPISTNNTSFFRAELEWNKFTDFLIKKYQHTDKVNIHCYACSDGAEPFSLAILLIKKLGEGAKKFFPIIASDIDPKILENPKKGKVILSDCDIVNIEDELGTDYSKFIKHNDDFKLLKEYNAHDEVCEGTVSPEVRKAVVFKSYDIMDNITNIPAQNTVVMARNFWPYLPEEKQQSLAKKIANQLSDTSTLVLGTFDKRESSAINAITDNGFKDTSVDHCFEKPSTREKDLLINPEFLKNTFIPKK